MALFFTFIDKRLKICYKHIELKLIFMDKIVFIQNRLAGAMANLVENKEKFIADFVNFSSASRFSVENAEKIVDFLANPANHKIGSTVIADGLKINIDWANPKPLGAVKLELHKLYYDVHISTIFEGIYELPEGMIPEVL